MVRAKLVVLLVLGLVAGTAFLGAQTVAEDILKGQEIQGIEFKNYIGPHRIIESRQAIQGIGADLGRQMAVPGATEADYAGKYHVVRIHDPASDKLSADVFILGPDAGVDHIRNLNWIVSAYLQQVFGYSVTDADLLANFVTRYNAYYRGKLDYVRAVYIPRVAENVTGDNLGISTEWTDWAGKTKMLIPLRDSLSKGLAGSLNTEEVSNKDMVKNLAQEPDQGLAERKKLADLKESEIVKEQKAVAQVEAQPQTPKVPSDTGTTPQGPTLTPANPPAAPAGSPLPGTTPVPISSPVPSPSPAPTPVIPLEQAKKQLDARDKALQAERQDIVKKETTPGPSPVPSPVPPAKPAVTAAFIHMNEGSKMGQVWLIDPTADKVWKKSDLNTVRQTSVSAFGPGWLVVAGDTRASNGAVRLVLVSKDDASVLATGNDDVAPAGSLVVSGNLAYALTKDPKGNWVLGAFDPGLQAKARGTDPLTSVTAVVPTAAGILVQEAGGSVILLDSATLKKKSTTGE